MQMLIRIQENYSDTEYSYSSIVSIFSTNQQYRFFEVLGFLAFLGGRYEELFLVAKREHPRLLGG
jgi:hypothetical protein